MGILYVRNQNGELTSVPSVVVRVQNADSPGGGIPSGGIPIPKYVETEASRVANDVKGAENANTITFIATSDIHYSFDSVPETMESFSDDLGNAVRLLRNTIAPDFEADLGDKVFGATAYTNEDTVGEAMVVIEKLGYAKTRLECLGNHDTHNSTVAQRAVFTAGRNRGAVYGDNTNGYCYRDFGNTRVIVLNTSEMGDDTYSSALTMSTAQLAWVCNTLSEMAKKSGYHILFLSHMPPDWGVLDAESTLLKIIKAYEAGGSYTVSGTTYDFSATNRADIIGWAHGHLHNHKTRKIEGTDIWRFCIPGALGTRANEYSNTTDYPRDGFQELYGDETLKKSDYVLKSATSTAFSVVVVDTAQRKIRIVDYGAGSTKRQKSVINYGSEVVYYSISNVLTNVTNSNISADIEEGATYTAKLTVTAGELTSVKVTMGGVDVTDTVYSNGTITIGNVTGNIVITATAIVEDFEYGEFTNLVPTSTVLGGTAIYNGTGYKDGYRISGGTGEAALAGYVTTGVMPYAITNEDDKYSFPVIYIKGATLDLSDSACRWTGINANNASRYETNGGASATANQITHYFTVEELGTQYYKLTPVRGNFDSICAMKMSLKGSGAKLIITAGEPIGTENGGNSGGDTGGDSGATGTYTNLVPTSVSPLGTGVYNGKGYKDGAYVTGINDGGEDASCAATGLIQIDSNVKAIYIKGANWDTSNGHVRFYTVSSVGAATCSHQVKADGSGSNKLTDFFTVETLGTNYYKWTLTSGGKAALVGKYYCISLVGTGANLVITHDEPIE